MSYSDNEEPIKASSTPKTPNNEHDSVNVDSVNACSNAISPNSNFSTPDIPNRDIRDNSILPNELTEESPLLPPADLENGLLNHIRRSESARYNFCYINWLIPLIAVTAAIVFVAILIIPQLPALLDAAITTDIASASIVNISHAGVSIQVHASLDVKYHNIDNRFYAGVLAFAALMIQTVIVAPKNATHVLVDIDNSHQPLHSADLYIPPLEVDLHKSTHLIFTTDVIFNEENVASLAATFLSRNLSLPLPVSVALQMSPRISHGWFFLNTGPLTVRHNQLISPDLLTFPLAVEDMQLNVDDGKLLLNANVVLDAIPLELDLPTVHWSVSVANCHSVPAFLGPWVSDLCSVTPGRLSEFFIHGRVEELSSELSTSCPNSGISPINSFLNTLMQNHSLDVFLQASPSKENAHNLPRWLFDILSQNAFPVHIPISVFELSLDFHDMISNFHVHNIDINLPEATDSSSLNVESAMSTLLALKMPFSTRNLNLNLNTFNFSAEVTGDNGPFLRGFSTSLSNAISLSAAQNAHDASVQTNFTYFVTSLLDPATAGRLLSDILLGNTPKNDYSIAYEVPQANLELQFVNTTLRNLHWINTILHTTTSSSNGLLEWLLQQLTISLQLVKLTQSGKDWVELKVDVLLTNPFNVSLAAIDELVSVEYLYHDTKIGNVTIPNINFPRTDEAFPLSLTALVDCSTVESRKNAELFMSHVISQDYNITMGLQGSQQRAAHRSGSLDSFLRNVKVPQLPFPHMKFPKPEVQQGNPFILEATIHILTSEVEVTVFNPIKNSPVHIQIHSCQAVYEDQTLAFVEHVRPIMVNPGVHTTRRIPYKVEPKFGSDILRRALNGQLEVEVVADLGFAVGQFDAQILYKGNGIVAKVRL